LLVLFPIHTRLFDTTYDNTTITEGGPIIDQIGIVGESAPSEGWTVGVGENKGFTKNFILARATTHSTQPTRDEDGENAFKQDEWIAVSAETTATASITFPRDCGADDKSKAGSIGPTGPTGDETDDNNLWGTGLGIPAIGGIFGAVLLGAGYVTYRQNRTSTRRRGRRLPSIILKQNGGVGPTESNTSSEFASGYMYTTAGQPKGQRRRRQQRLGKKPSRNTPLGRLKVSSRAPPTSPFSSSAHTASSDEGSRHEMPVSALEMQLQHPLDYPDNNWTGQRGVNLGVGLFGRSPAATANDDDDDEMNVEAVVANTKAVYYDPTDRSRSNFPSM
jgi:hypothetical protein